MQMGFSIQTASSSSAASIRGEGSRVLEGSSLERIARRIPS
jgi:hypothetical protein